MINLKSFPVEEAGKLVTVNCCKLGKFLTLTSFAEFTSVVIGPPLPSSLNIAYPVMGQPPSFSGISQLIVIWVTELDTREGLDTPWGETQDWT